MFTLFLDRREADSDPCEQVLDTTETICNSSNGGFEKKKKIMTLMCTGFEQGRNHLSHLCTGFEQGRNCYTCVQVLNRSKTICDTCVQVCEVYKLHKETYYLAVNFIDRFLLATEKIKTSKLQLVGVTALFMASKIEVGKMIVWCIELHGAKDWTVPEKYAAVVVYCDLFWSLLVLWWLISLLSSEAGIRSRHIKSSKEHLSIMTRTHNLHILG